jgi:hypothetical protein
VGGSLWRREAHQASGIRRPPPNGKHVSSEQLPMQGQPREKLALGLRICIPDFLRLEARMATQELNVVSRASTVGSIRGQGLRDGVRLVRHQLQGLDHVPYL